MSDLSSDVFSSDLVDALFVVVHVAHRGYFSLSRLATAVGTIDDTSPPQRAMSRMYFDAMAELADADGRNSVWTTDTLRLICAWEISLSKSMVERRPLMMKSAPTSAARSTTSLRSEEQQSELQSLMRTSY